MLAWPAGPPELTDKDQRKRVKSPMEERVRKKKGEGRFKVQKPLFLDCFLPLDIGRGTRNVPLTVRRGDLLR